MKKVSFTACAAYCPFSANTLFASSDPPLESLLRIPLHTKTEVSFQLAAPTLQCGAHGLPAHECTLGGILKVQGDPRFSGTIPYHCIVRYTYLDSGTDSRDSRFDSPMTPGVAGWNSPVTSDKHSYQQPPALSKTVPVTHQGTAIHRGAINLANGHGEWNLKGSPPLKLIEKAHQRELVSVDCVQD